MPRRTAWTCTLALTALGLAACQGGGQQARDLPSLREIESRVTPSVPTDLPQLTSNRRVMASIQRLDLPLDVPLDKAWALVDEEAVSSAARRLWQDNGLRVGLIPRGDLDKLLKALPTPTGLERAMIIGSDYPTALRSTPRLNRPLTVILTVPPRTVREETLSGGRLRLLARMLPDDFGQVQVDLLPHHYKPELSLKPRSPLEKDLDGRLLDELTARLHVPTDELIVVGLHYPWPEHDPNALPSVDFTAGPQQGQPMIFRQDSDATDQQEEADEDPPADKAASLAEARAQASGDRQPDEESGARRRIVLHTPETEGKTPAKVRAQEPADPASPGAAPPPLPRHLGRALMTASRAGNPHQFLLLIAVKPTGGLQRAPARRPAPLSGP